MNVTTPLLSILLSHFKRIICFETTFQSSQGIVYMIRDGGKAQWHIRFQVRPRALTHIIVE